MADSGNNVPGWVWVTTPAIALAFAGFIFYLSTVPAGNELDAVKGDARKALEATAAQAREDKQKATETAKPSYDFYRLLEKQTVEVQEVEAYKSTPKDAAVKYEYRLQAGSFRSEMDADRMRAQLILEGLPAYLESSSVNSSTWHRVFVGPYTNRSKMNKAQDILVSNNVSPLVLKQKVSSKK
ncbi:MAG: SPOR domain-containing protein [Alcanivorax sp.]|jgi:cell division protein FtsN|tara:strand:+ start:608 stop:1156 length:549 start_codon:yes stop_codon:yes gene_type:complete